MAKEEEEFIIVHHSCYGDGVEGLRIYPEEDEYLRENPGMYTILEDRVPESELDTKFTYWEKEYEK